MDQSQSTDLDFVYLHINSDVSDNLICLYAAYCDSLDVDLHPNFFFYPDRCIDSFLKMAAFSVEECIEFAWETVHYSEAVTLN